MVKEISGLRVARSTVTPSSTTAVVRELDFQLGPRQGIQIFAVLPTVTVDAASTGPSSSVVGFDNGNQTLHLETGSLETVPDNAAEDEDTIDSEIFMRQDVIVGGNDDSATEFRSSLAITVTPSGLVTYPRPILAARNISHRGIVDGTSDDLNFHVLIYYVFVEFQLSELGLILARRT